MAWNRSVETPDCLSQMEATHTWLEPSSVDGDIERNLETFEVLEALEALAFPQITGLKRGRGRIWGEPECRGAGIYHQCGNHTNAGDGET